MAAIGHIVAADELELLGPDLGVDLGHADLAVAHVAALDAKVLHPSEGELTQVAVLNATAWSARIKGERRTMRSAASGCGGQRRSQTRTDMSRCTLRGQRMAVCDQRTGRCGPTAARGPEYEQRCRSGRWRCSCGSVPCAKARRDRSRLHRSAASTMSRRTNDERGVDLQAVGPERGVLEKLDELLHVALDADCAVSFPRIERRFEQATWQWQNESPQTSRPRRHAPLGRSGILVGQRATRSDDAHVRHDLVASIFAEMKGLADGADGVAAVCVARDVLVDGLRSDLAAASSAR